MPVDVHTASRGIIIQCLLLSHRHRFTSRHTDLILRHSYRLNGKSLIVDHPITLEMSGISSASSVYSAMPASGNSILQFIQIAIIAFEMVYRHHYAYLSKYAAGAFFSSPDAYERV